MAAADVFGIVGSVVGGAYQVKEVVAEGGFGVVYRAYHGGFRAPVALKCLKIPGQFSREHEEEFLEQFRAEAELLFRLSASLPTVVRPLTIDAITTAQGVFMPYMALEWLQGETLEAIAEQRRAVGRPFTLPELVRLLTPVAQALEKAHKFVGPSGPISIVHRDMKPENIFVAQVAGEQTVKILDFGIGKAKSLASQVAGRASQTPSAAASFTPAYGAPEQWMPNKYGQTGPWTDVWGLALTLVEVLAGRHIMDGDTAAMMGTALDPASRPTPRTVGVAVSDQVEAVFQRALALDPRQRYGDAGVFWRDLLAALGATDAKAAHPGQAGQPAIPDLGAAAASPAAIPDLDVASAPTSGRAAVKKAETPMSVMDMDDFGVEGQRVELALDLPDGEPVSKGAVRSVRKPRVLPVGPPPEAAGEPSGEPADAAGTAGEGTAELGQPAAGESPAGSADAAALAQAKAEPKRTIGESLTALWDRLAEFGREMFDEDAPLGLRLIPGIALVVLALLVTVADQIHSASSDEVFTIGPLRAGWVAGPFLLGGIAFIVYRIVQHYR